MIGCMLNVANHESFEYSLADYTAEWGSIRQLAQLTNIPYASLVSWRQKPGAKVIVHGDEVTVVKPPRKKHKGSNNNAERSKAIAERYLHGETLQEIAHTYGISRERIRQILAKQNIFGPDGGAAAMAKKRHAAKKKSTEQAFIQKWGMGRSQQRALRTGLDGSYNSSPVCRFIMQRRNAMVRKIEWNFTFADWWEIWKASGKWHLAGRGKGFYVMARLGDKGPYAPWNVKIIPFEQNNSEYIRRYWHEVKAGKRPPPSPPKNNRQRSRVEQFEIGAPFVVCFGSLRAYQTNLQTFARKHGMGFRANFRDGVLHVVRTS